MSHYKPAPGHKAVSDLNGIIKCSCGWNSDPMRTGQGMDGAWRNHIESVKPWTEAEIRDALADSEESCSCQPSCKILGDIVKDYRDRNVDDVVKYAHAWKKSIEGRRSLMGKRMTPRQWREHTRKIIEAGRALFLALEAA